MKTLVEDLMVDDEAFAPQGSMAVSISSVGHGLTPSIIPAYQGPLNRLDQRR